MSNMIDGNCLFSWWIEGAGTKILYLSVIGQCVVLYFLSNIDPWHKQICLKYRKDVIEIAFILRHSIKPGNWCGFISSIFSRHLWRNIMGGLLLCLGMVKVSNLASLAFHHFSFVCFLCKVISHIHSVKVIWRHFTRFHRRSKTSGASLWVL